MKNLSTWIYISIIILSIPTYFFMSNNLSSLPILTINFILGIYLLVKGSDYFVEGAASIAAHKNVSEHTIGLTLVALATSLPEFAVSTLASFAGHPVTAWGNAVGSNIANIGLVLGIAALLMPLSLSKHIRKDAGVLILVTGILAFMVIVFRELLWWMGVLFLFIYGLYIWEIKGRDEEIEEVPIEHSWTWSWVYVIAGASGIVWGAEIVIKSAVNIAIVMHIPEIIIAITAIAIGTSLPEMATSVAASLKKKYGIAVGNVLGSNIFNTLIVLGTSAIINPIKISYSELFSNLVFLVIFSAAAALMCIKRKIGRWEGALLLAIYAIFFIFLVLYP